MADVDIKSDRVLVDEGAITVKVEEEDFESLRDIYAHIDALNKYRQEMGRLTQLITNMCATANDVESELSEKRKALALKYKLEDGGSGQWAIDFERKEFVKTAPKAPVIP